MVNEDKPQTSGTAAAITTLPQPSSPAANINAGKQLLTSAIPMNPDEDEELLDMELDQLIAADTFGTLNNGLAFIYYGDYVVDFKQIRFLLFTSEVNNRAELTHFLKPATLNRTHWDPEKPTKIYIHGFSQSGTDLVKNLRSAYFDDEQNEPANQPNLIIVDWGRYAHLIEYFFTAKYIVPMIGIAVGKLIHMLLNHEVEPSDRPKENRTEIQVASSKSKKKNTRPDLIHLIGHSLGAQIASAACSHSRVKPARITALDPAGPFYQGIYPCPSISKKDAKFVDVIHSGMSIFGYGMYGQVGHVDFYPNGGGWQNGCPWWASLDNHERSVLYFIESVKSTRSDTKFYGRKAESWSKYKRGQLLSKEFVEMGEYLQPDLTLYGKYYLTTNRFPPYAKGKNP